MRATLIAVALLGFGACAHETPAPEPTPTPAPLASPSPSPSPENPRQWECDYERGQELQRSKRACLSREQDSCDYRRWWDYYDCLHHGEEACAKVVPRGAALIEAHYRRCLEQWHP